MCNRLHGGFKKIKAEGYGYKIFNINDTPCFMNNQRYSTIDNWVIWNCEEGKGFCFFTSKKEAIRLLKKLKNSAVDEYKNHYIKRIKYRKGLGKNVETNITNEGEKYIIAICKEFKILGLVEVK